MCIRLGLSSCKEGGLLLPSSFCQEAIALGLDSSVVAVSVTASVPGGWHSDVEAMALNSKP